MLRVVKGFNVFGVDVLDMCLVLDVVIRPKFKVLDFEKYKENLMIHYFQDSLSGASLDWYMHLERTHIRTCYCFRKVVQIQSRYDS